MPAPPKILIVATDSMTVSILMRGQLQSLRDRGFRVEVAAAPGRDLEEAAEREQVRCIPVPMKRAPDPILDIVSLSRLSRLIRRSQPRIVSASTPKAGLLGMIAAHRAGTPSRVYVLRGLRLETSRGLSKILYLQLERLACTLAGTVVCVSRSLQDRVVDLGLVDGSKAIVLGEGSSNGVDVERFAPASTAEKHLLRQQLGLPADAFVVGFVGRLTYDKGAGDLSRIYDLLVSRTVSQVVLLVVGEFEVESRPFIQRSLKERPQVILPGRVEDTSSYYRAMDLLMFPSYREGLPNAVLEAASCELAVAGYSATGTIDAVANGKTGVLVPKGETDALATAILRYLEDDELRRRHGLEGRRRALRYFRQQDVWQRWFDFYRSLLDREERAALDCAVLKNVMSREDQAASQQYGP